jgi:hypothetical protein
LVGAEFVLSVWVFGTRVGLKRNISLVADSFRSGQP